MSGKGKPYPGSRSTTAKGARGGPSARILTSAEGSHRVAKAGSLKPKEDKSKSGMEEEVLCIGAAVGVTPIDVEASSDFNIEDTSGALSNIPFSSRDTIVIVHDSPSRMNAGQKEVVLSQENVYILKKKNESIIDFAKSETGLPLAAQVIHHEGRIEQVEPIDYGLAMLVNCESEQQEFGPVEGSKAKKPRVSWADDVEMEQQQVRDSVEMGKMSLNEQINDAELEMEMQEPTESSEDSVNIRTMHEDVEIEFLMSTKRYDEIQAVKEKWLKIEEEVRVEKERKKAQQQLEDQKTTSVEELRIAKDKEKEKEEQLIKANAKERQNMPKWIITRNEIANLAGLRGKIHKMLTQVVKGEIKVDQQRGGDLRAQFNFRFLQNWWLLKKSEYDEIVQWSAAVIKELGQAQKTQSQRQGNGGNPWTGNKNGNWNNKGKVALSTINEGSIVIAWENVVVGYFPRKTAYSFQFVRDLLLGKWRDKGLDKVLLNEVGYYFLLFNESNIEDVDKLCSEGFVSVGMQQMKIFKWEEGYDFNVPPPETAKVWIVLMNIPPHLINPEIISFMAKIIGQPLYLDPAIEDLQMISYARVCVEITPRSELPNEIVLMTRTGRRIPITVHYAWRPNRCTSCYTFGHITESCPRNAGNGVQDKDQGQGDKAAVDRAKQDPPGQQEGGIGLQIDPVASGVNGPELMEGYQHQDEVVEEGHLPVSENQVMNTLDGLLNETNDNHIPEGNNNVEEAVDEMVQEPINLALVSQVQTDGDDVPVQVDGNKERQRQEDGNVEEEHVDLNNLSELEFK